MNREARSRADTLTPLAVMLGLVAWPCVASGWLAAFVGLMGRYFVPGIVALVGSYGVPLTAIVIGHVARAAHAKASRSRMNGWPSTLALAGSYVLVVTGLAVCGLGIISLWAGRVGFIRSLAMP